MVYGQAHIKHLMLFKQFDNFPIQVQLHAKIKATFYLVSWITFKNRNNLISCKMQVLGQNFQYLVWPIDEIAAFKDL